MHVIHHVYFLNYRYGKSDDVHCWHNQSRISTGNSSFFPFFLICFVFVIQLFKLSKLIQKKTEHQSRDTKYRQHYRTHSYKNINHTAFQTVCRSVSKTQVTSFLAARRVSREGLCACQVPPYLTGDFISSSHKSE